MNTLPSPSTASPLKQTGSATKARWSGACPGVATATRGPKASPPASVTVPSPDRAAAIGGSPECSLRTLAAARVLAEGGELGYTQTERVVGARSARAQPDRAQAAEAVVAVDVLAGECP